MALSLVFLEGPRRALRALDEAGGGPRSNATNFAAEGQPQIGPLSRWEDIWAIAQNHKGLRNLQK
jgi:hypothetical protein